MSKDTSQARLFNQTLAKVLNVLEEPFTPANAKEFHDLIDEFGKQYFHPKSAFAHSFLAQDKLRPFV